VTRVAPGGERVRRRILDDVELRRRDTESEGEGLDDVVQDLLLVGTDLTGPALREDDLVAGEVRREARADRDGSAARPPPGAKYSPTKYPSSAMIAVNTAIRTTVRQRLAAAAS